MLVRYVAITSAAIALSAAHDHFPTATALPHQDILEKKSRTRHHQRGLASHPVSSNAVYVDRCRSLEANTRGVDRHATLRFGLWDPWNAKYLDSGVVALFHSCWQWLRFPSSMKRPCH